jgi:hypothetical protein
MLVPHVRLAQKKLKMLKTEFEPTTPWSLEAYNIRLLL